MDDKEVLDWIDQNCVAHINWEGKFVLLAKVSGLSTPLCAFEGIGVREAVERAKNRQVGFSSPAKIFGGKNRRTT